MGASYKLPKTATPAILSLLVAQHNAIREAAVSTNIHYTTTPRGDAGDLNNLSSPTALAATLAAPVIDVDAIVEETATVAEADEYTGDDILTDATWLEPDFLVVTGAGAGAFTNPSSVVLTGTYLGAAVTDTVAFASVDGGTLYGDQLIDPNGLTSVAVAAQADVDGTISVGRAHVPECIALANEIKGILNVHFADTLAHATAVSAQIATADATTFATANTLATALKAAYNTHCSASNVHPNNDGTNTIAAADATTVATLIALLTELRTDVTAHIAASLAGAHIDLVD